MTDEIQPNQQLPEGTQVVEQTVIKKGTLQFGSKAAFNNPAPRWLIVSMNTIIGMNSSGAVFVASINGISDHFRNTIIIVLGATSFLCQHLKHAFGVVDTTA